MNPGSEPPSIRALLIAESANPEWVSVPLVGWSLARALSGVAETHLVTQIRNREALLRAGLREWTDFTAIDSEALARPLYRLAAFLRGGEGKGWTTLAALEPLSYWYFERLVWKRFGDELRGGRYDVVHRITPLSPTTPSPIARRIARTRAKFIVGPLNGGLRWPPQFRSAQWREREWLASVRGVHRLLPAYRATRRHASAIIVGSTATLAQLPSRHRERAVLIPENGIDPARFRKRAAPYRGGQLKVAFAGRLVPYKGVDILLDALASPIRAGRVAVDILGDGPEMARLKEQVAREGIERGVTLAGWVEHGRLQDRLIESHVFGFPSFREFGGAVVLEALALGLVPIVIDYGGPGDLITTGTAFGIPLGARADVVAGFRAAFERILECPEILEPLRVRGAERIEQLYTWRAKAVQVAEVYRWVLGQRAEKPVFPFIERRDAEQ